MYDTLGSASDVLRVVDIDRPVPGPGEVRVRIAFSGVNPTDWKSRSGLTARAIDGFQIPHQDGAGTIDAVGSGVDPSRVGERVWVWLAAAGRKWGTAAEWSVVPADHAIALAPSASFELGASVGVPAMTAHRCLFADGPVAGQTVLVAGGAGAVGHFAIELAKRAGATVITTVSSPEKAALARAAGADLVVDYRREPAVERIKAFGPVDRVVEVSLGANLELDLAVLRIGGSIVCYAATGDDPTLPVRSCMNANVALRFVLLYSVPAPALEEATGEISESLRAGQLSALPTKVFPLEDVVAAQEAVEGGFTGKVLVALQ
jgi:NADPH2:quinone reductase